MQPFKITGQKNILLDAQEIAIVLDALTAKPYAQVAPLIDKIVTQVRDYEPEVVASGD